MNLLPFDSLKTCPACGKAIAHPRVTYSTDVKTPAGSGQFVAMTTVGDAPVPHLEKHCPCGYGWLEETAGEAATVRGVVRRLHAVIDWTLEDGRLKSVEHGLVKGLVEQTIDAVTRASGAQR